MESVDEQEYWYVYRAEFEARERTNILSFEKGVEVNPISIFIFLNKKYFLEYKKMTTKI